MTSSDNAYFIPVTTAIASSITRPKHVRVLHRRRTTAGLTHMLRTLSMSTCVSERNNSMSLCLMDRWGEKKSCMQFHTCSMASARCLLSFCSLLRSFSMSHCKSSTVVSISDTFVSELVTLSTNSLYFMTIRHKNRHVIHYSHTPDVVDMQSHSPPTYWCHTRQHQQVVPKISYLQRHLVVSALQEGSQVSQSTVLIK